MTSEHFTDFLPSFCSPTFLISSLEGSQKAKFSWPTRATWKAARPQKSGFWSQVFFYEGIKNLSFIKGGDQSSQVPQNSITSGDRLFCQGKDVGNFTDVPQKTTFYFKDLSTLLIALTLFLLLFSFIFQMAYKVAVTAMNILGDPQQTTSFWSSACPLSSFICLFYQEKFCLLLHVHTVTGIGVSGALLVKGVKWSFHHSFSEICCSIHKWEYFSTSQLTLQQLNLSSNTSSLWNGTSTVISVTSAQLKNK